MGNLSQEYAINFELAKINLKSNYYKFFIHAWKILEPTTPLDDNWHIKYLCDLLQAEAERIAAGQPKQKDIIINIPPRSLKSSIFSIMLNAWVWTRFPQMKFITGSYNGNLANEFAVKTRRLIESEWYQERFGNVFHMAADQNMKSLFENNKTGLRKSVGAGGGVTGSGGDFIILDDPQDPLMAHSEVERKNCIDWYDQVIYSRLNDQNVGVRIIVMQRLHEDDLCGYLLYKASDKYNYICLPGEDSFPINPPDLKHYYIDGLFFSKRFSKSILTGYKETLFSNYAGQIGQQPSPLEGDIIKTDKFRYYDTLPCEMHEWDEIIDSWDLTFKGKATSDWVVGTTWARKGSNKYMLGLIRGKFDIMQTLAAIRSNRLTWPHLRATLIEDKANGPAVISMLGDEISGIIAYNPDRDKVSRAYAVSPQIEAGNVWLPKGASWLNDFLNECKLFPRGKHDDQVDSFTCALIRFANASPAKFNHEATRATISNNITSASW